MYTSGQSNKQFALVNYNSLPDLKTLHITTLGS